MKIERHDSMTKAAARGFRASATTAAAASLAAALALTPARAAATAELADPAILGKLQLWVAADDAAHVATGPGGKLCWFDKRETSTSAPTHVYAESVGTSDPEVGTFAGRTAMDFGTWGSKRYMAWKKPSGAAIPITDHVIRHVFAVYAMNDVSFGCIFGSVGTLDVSSSFLYGSHYPANNKSAPYFCNTQSRSIIWNGRAWLDGRRFDGHHETPADGYYRHGFHLYEVAPSPWKGGAANAFFAWRENSTIPSGAGYLCEALVFTNALTEVERVAVEDYLMERWSLGTRDKVVNVADGETLTIDASAGDVAEDRLRFAGSGTVVKSGSGTFSYASANPQDFHGSLRIDAGAVNLVTPLPVAASAGDRLTAAVGAGRMVTRTADAGAGTIVKDGAGELTLAEVPANLAKLDVRAGTLTVRRKPVNVGRVLGTPVPVAIPNASFEEIVGDSALDNGCKMNKSNEPPFHGWSGNAAWFFYWPTWKANASSVSSGKGSLFLGNVAPPDGDCALFFRWENAYAETDVTIPSAGVYALSLEALGPSAWNPGFLGAQCAVKLLDAGGAVVADFGCAKYENSGQYLEKTLVATIAEPGTYRLRLANGPLAVVVDNLRLAKVAEIDDSVFPIPNGDFEAAAMLTGANAAVITNENSCVGWALGLDGGTIAAVNPEVALTTRIMVNTNNGYNAYNGAGGYYNDSRAPAGGYVELLFRGAGARATTTFTAPAGTHYLRCAAAFLFASPSTVEATVTAGGSTVSLGSLAPDNKLMRNRCFPVPFTLAAETEITLTLACTDGATDNSKGTVLDDFALVPFNDGAIGDNLVVNGDFEDDSEHSSAWRAAAGTVWVSRPYSSDPSFGSDPSDGAGFLSLAGRNAACQDIAFPEAGRYRLRFHHRDWGKWGDPMATYAYIAKDGVTNALCRFGATGVRYTAHVEDIADFDIPAAGSYSLGFAGAEAGNVQVIIDDVEVRRISDRFDDTAAVMPQNMELDVASDAHVVLDFRGTQRVSAVVLGGRYVSGVVGASTHPEFFSGSGRLEAPARATVIVMK